jgi:asparagine synthase (glutamine-hydrolysing)
MGTMINTYLETHTVFPWYVGENGLFRGYVYDQNDNYLINEAAWQYVNGQVNQKQYIINGAFIFVRSDANECTIISDQGRSFSLFFILQNNQWHVGDDGWKMSDSLGLVKDEEQAFHFEAFSFCPDHATPWKGLSQIQANEVIVLKDNGELSVADGAVLPETALNFEQANNQMMKRLLSEKIEGNYVIPLSGGWDSRHLLSNLIQHGVTNVVTYTYGNPESSEVKIAKSIAEKLQVNWHFVEYNPELLSQIMGGKGRDFLHYASQGVSSPQEQEFFALLELTKNGHIKKGDVILPGYCGDLPAGSYVMTDVNPSDKAQPRTIKRWLRDRHLVFARGSGVEDKLLKTLYSALEPSDDLSCLEWNALHERWFIREKVSKYVLNGLRTFEYFGIEWRMPLWDLEWLAYSYSCHFEQRRHRAHFKSQANELLFKPLGVPHLIHENPRSWKSKVKSQIKDYIPTQWIQRWAKLRIKTADLDNTNGRYLVSHLKNHCEVTARWSDESVNPYIAAYIWKLLR